MNRRVVLDTSTLVSAALRVGSVPYQVLTEALSSWDVCASVESLSELEQVLAREKFDRYLARSMRDDFVMLMRRTTHLFVVQTSDGLDLSPSCRDPADNKFLCLALVAKADVIVSSDLDLLSLHPWREKTIMTPADFLSKSTR